MRYFLLFIFTFSTSKAVDILEPTEEEKDKVGEYTLYSKGLPKAYKKIWNLTKFSPERSTVRILPAQPDVSSKKLSFQWSIYTPKSYKADFSTGLIILSTNVLVNDIPDQWKSLCEEHNYILIIPDFSSNRRFTVEMCYASKELIKARYKIDLKNINYFALSKNIRHYFHLHSSSELNGIIAINTDLTWASNQFRDYIKIEKFLPQLLEASRTKPMTLVSFDRKNGKKPDEFQNYMDSSNNFYKKLNYTKILRHKFEIEAPEAVKVNETIKMQNGQTIVVTREEDGEFHKRIFEKIPYESLTKIFDFNKGLEEAKKVDLFKQAEKYKSTQKLGLALTMYERLHRKYKDEKAFEEFKELVQKLNKAISETKKLFNEKLYPEAKISADITVKLFGSNLAKDLKPILSSLSKDKLILKELKAAEYLEKIKNAIAKKRTAKTKIVQALKEVIDYCPGTKTAEKAKSILDSL